MLLSACDATTPSPPPANTSAATTSASAQLVASPGPTTEPTPGDTQITPSPSEPAHSSSPGTPLSSAVPYLELPNFPGAGNFVTDVAVGGPGLVAVGYAKALRPTCDSERFARVWTSTDGTSWNQSDIGDQRAWFTNVVVMNGSLYAFADAAGYCHGGNLADVWTSADGLAWTQIASGIASVPRRLVRRRGNRHWTCCFGLCCGGNGLPAALAVANRS